MPSDTYRQGCRPQYSGWDRKNSFVDRSVQRSTEPHCRNSDKEWLPSWSARRKGKTVSTSGKEFDIEVGWIILKTSCYRRVQWFNHLHKNPCPKWSLQSNWCKYACLFHNVPYPQVSILYAGEDRLTYVNALIKAGASVNHIDAFLQSPLMTLVKRGRWWGEFQSISLLHVLRIWLISHFTSLKDLTFWCIGNHTWTCVS